MHGYTENERITKCVYISDISTSMGNGMLAIEK